MSGDREVVGTGTFDCPHCNELIRFTVTITASRTQPWTCTRSVQVVEDHDKTCVGRRSS